MQQEESSIEGDLLVHMLLFVVALYKGVRLFTPRPTFRQTSSIFSILGLICMLALSIRRAAAMKLPC